MGLLDTSLYRRCQCPGPWWLYNHNQRTCSFAWIRNSLLFPFHILQHTIQTLIPKVHIKGSSSSPFLYQGCNPWMLMTASAWFSIEIAIPKRSLLKVACTRSAVNPPATALEVCNAAVLQMYCTNSTPQWWCMYHLSCTVHYGWLLVLRVLRMRLGRLL